MLVTQGHQNNCFVLNNDCTNHFLSFEAVSHCFLCLLHTGVLFGVVAELKVTTVLINISYIVTV